MLTKKQKQVLDFISSYHKKKGYAPSLEEIRKKLKVASVSTAHFHIKKLQEEGFLNKEENSPRSISVYESQQMVKIPLMGTIAAGQPIEAIQEKETIAIPKTKIMRSGNFYALRVAGKSMIDENINDGDIILVKEQQVAENGQKVVALIDNYEATLKTFYKEKNQIRLQPANKEYEPIIIKKDEQEIIIQGLVVDVIKNKILDTEIIKKKEEKQVKKYSKLPLNKIICGDVVEELKKIPDHSIDLIVADPPYWKVINEKWDYKWRTENDYIIWCKQWLKELVRITKKTGSFYLFGYFKTLAYLLPEIEKEGFSLRQQIIINKGMRSVSGRATKNYKMFPNVTESILFFAYNNQPEIKKFLLDRQKETDLTAKEINEAMEVKSNGGGLWSLYTGKNILAQIPTKEQWEKLEKILKFKKPYSEVNFIFNAQMGFTDVWNDIDFYKEKRYHPTQKPVRLIERIVKASSNEGMTVLDPFVGAGSTALACAELKRNYIGIDIDKKYTKIAKERIKNLKRTPKLF
ncbi:MAG: transcriptional repressor LexA [Patescibacteria group bacterium]|nr:transcriptional repressor LexA [Patescibacteria group bacterium]